MQRVILQHEGLGALTSKDTVSHVTCHSSLMFVNHCFFDFVRISRVWREQRRRGSTGWRFGLWLTHKHNEIRWLTHSAATLWCAVSTDDGHRHNEDQNLLDGAGSVRVCRNMNKNVILKQHFGHTLTVWVHCDGEQTLNRKMRSVWCPDTYSSNCAAHTLVKRIKTCIHLFHRREITVGSFLKKMFCLLFF